MELCKIKESLANTNIPIYERGKTNPPYIAVTLTETKRMYADDRLLIKTQGFTVELYTVNKDEKREIAIENALTELDIEFEKNEDKVPQENIYIVNYDCEVLI